MSEVKKLFLFIGGVAVLIVFLGLLAQGRFFPQKQEKTPKAKVADKEISLLVAKTEEARRKGLSGRESLEANQGMLFIFNEKDIQPRFWMKDMRFAIDILWINDGKIAHINQDVQPEPGVSDSQLKLYTPNQPIDYVLEVNAGVSSKNNFAVGQSVELTKIP